MYLSPDLSETATLYSENLHKLAYHLTGNHEDAQDLVQEAFLRAHSGAAGFRGEASVKTWLTRILINTFLQDRRKRQHVSLALDYLPAPDWSQNPEKIVVRRELQWCISHILSCHIPQRYAAALTLREVEGMSHREIAQTLGVSLSVAKVLIFRARRSFRHHLEMSGCIAYIRDYSCVCDCAGDGAPLLRQWAGKTPVMPP